MSWMAKLYETYPHAERLEGEKAWPNGHVKKNAHIEVIIDLEGNFLRTKELSGDENSTLIPVTEKSSSRTGNVEAHPLCEELSYCAFDLNDGVKKKAERNKSYLNLVTQWHESPYTHPKVDAVRKYVIKSTLWSDLSSLFEFPLVVKTKSTQKVTPDKCFIRWRIEEPGNPVSGTWEDDSLIQAWINFEQSLNPKNGFCYLTGLNTRLAKFHPKFIRNPGDGARLITQNDWDGFTFLGRFTDSKKEITESNIPSQVSEVSFDVTQKAHNTLRWLISRQGYRNGDQVVVAWAVSGNPIPKLIAETYDLEDFEEITHEEESILKTEKDLSADLGQRFAHSLKRYMAGYYAKLEPTESIVIMALDSATPGRMAITYYRDFMAKEYLETIEKWHREFAWHQRITKEVQVNGKKSKSIVRWLVSAPSPWSILNSAYGDIIKSNDTLKKNLYERILPCIAEGRTFPRDLVDLSIRRTSNPNSSEHWEWERNLGVACALYRGFFNRHPDKNKRRDYSMALETENTSRDYLYGRLLAVAEHIEEMAIWKAGEKARSTQASRLMQRFADRPFSSWANIEKGLVPYQQRLKSKLPPLESAYKKLLDDICSLFLTGDFAADKKLTGEYLLSFHCQRKWLREHKLEKGQWILKEKEELISETQEGE